MGAQPEGKKNDLKESGGEAAEQVPCICGGGGRTGCASDLVIGVAAIVPHNAMATA